MESLSVTPPLFALVLAATASFVACGAGTNGDAQSGGASGSAGKPARNGEAGAGASSAGSSGVAGTASDFTCPAAECGPALGIPNTTCPDGSIGGPTGSCLRLATGGCGWEVRSCAPESAGGAAGASAAGSGAGGAIAAGGDAAAGASNGGGGGASGAPSTDRCGGCGGNGQICIYQAGGPGPGRFVCATQMRCGAAAACACIVSQGTCNFMLEGGSPGYCVCDNGLE